MRRYFAALLAALLVIMGGVQYARAQASGPGGYAAGTIADYVFYNLNNYLLRHDSSYTPEQKAAIKSYASQVWDDHWVGGYILGKLEDLYTEAVGWFGGECTNPLYCNDGPIVGGDADGWTDDICAFPLQFDDNGRLIIPAMPLYGGEPLNLSDLWYYTTGNNSNGINRDSYQYGHDAVSAILWHTHLFNAANSGGDRRAWVGVNSVISAGELPNAVGTFGMASVTYKNWSQAGALTLKVHTKSVDRHGFAKNGTANGMNFAPCPSGGASGGDFDFYAHGSLTDGGGQKCVAYAPRPSVSENGYAYPKWTSVPLSGFNPSNDKNVSAQPWLAGCTAKKELLLAIMNLLVSEACQQGGLTCDPVEPDDLVGDPPLDDLADPAPQEPTTPTPPGPAPTPTPTPTPSPTGSGDPNADDPIPGLGDPQVPGLSFWLPELPALDLSFASECPVYSFEALEQTFIFDHHCPFIQANAQTIALLMLAAFSIASVMIVLRA